MDSDPRSQPLDHSSTGGVPPVIGGTPPTPIAGPLPPETNHGSEPVRRLVAGVLSLCLALFLADACVSVFDDSLILFARVHVLDVIRGLLSFLAFLAAMLTYGLMGLTPMIPKRVFVPITLFNPAAGLVGIPFLIYFYDHMQLLDWAVSLCQVILAISVLWWLRGRLGFRLPLVAPDQLVLRRFSWVNLSVFALVNVLVIVPGVLVYLFVCATMAIDHFSEGFLELRPSGLNVQARTYVRADGKTIQLVPMSHIGERAFYHQLSRSFPSNSIVLMEGVTDDRNLLTNKISYERMAKSLGVAEQHQEFRPTQGRWVPADVDVQEFGTNTIDFLNLVMRVHLKGLKVETLLPLVQYSPPPNFQEQLLADLLKKRNRHLLDELHARLGETDHFIVPWGAAHIPAIAREIQASGFCLSETRTFNAIQFRSGGKRNHTVDN